MPAEAAQTLASHCILFATADWDTPYWTNKQHTASQLAQKGWKVLYVESVGLRAPRLGSGLDLGRLARRLWRGLKGVRKVQDNVWVLSPLVLPVLHSHPWVRAFNQGLLAWMVRRFMHVQGSQRPLIWTYHPYVLELLQRLNAQANSRTGSLVYHCVDDLAAIPGVDATAFRAEERRLLKQADMVFTTSAALRDQCSPYNAQVHFHPNVVDVDHFTQAHRPGPLPADLQAIAEPRLAYIGALSDFKIDFQLLIAVAKARPEWNLVFIGDEREGQHSALLQQLGSLPNVHLLGYKTYAQLPDYLRGLNVGLLPTLINDYTRGMFPMKYFEYLAAGLPVVSTPLAFTQQEQVLELRIAATGAQFIEAIDAQLKLGRFSEAQSRATVGENTWGLRIDRMLEELKRHTASTPT